MFIYDNNIPVIKPRKKKRKKAPSLALRILKEIKSAKRINYTTCLYFGKLLHQNSHHRFFLNLLTEEILIKIYFIFFALLKASNVSFLALQ